MATILAFDDTRGTPVSNATHSGYQRVQVGTSTLLMDTGCPPPLELSAEAHAGCLAFEFSNKQQRIIINCGLPAIGKDSWRQIARATAAHSTVTLNGASSCEFLESSAFRRLFGTPIVAGPTRVTITREGDNSGAVLLRASHDGYLRRFRLSHHRALRISDDGERLAGEDMFVPDAESPALSGPDEFAIRFHLHPAIRANRSSDGHGAVLVFPNKDVWNFNAHADRVEIEESVYLAGSESPRRTVQLAIYGQARRVDSVHWTLIHVPPAAGTRRGHGGEPELPL